MSTQNTPESLAGEYAQRESDAGRVAGGYKGFQQIERAFIAGLAAAALAAARAGEAERASAMRPGESVDEVLNRWATGPAVAQMVVAEVRAAQHGGEAVDREALPDVYYEIRARNDQWTHASGPVPRSTYLMDTEVLLRLVNNLAARGDAAPTVSAEQVRDHLNAYEEVEGQCVSVTDLATLGIEVKP